MTRQVKRPTHEIREVEELVEVEVPSTRAVEVDGYRVDDVEDTKVVEVEELQEFEYQAHPTGNSEMARTRDLGRAPNSRIARSTGSVYQYGHPAERAVDIDSNPPSPKSHRRSLHGRPATRPAWHDHPSSASRAHSSYSHSRPHSAYMPTGGASWGRGKPGIERGAGRDKRYEEEQRPRASLGLSVKNTHTRHSDGTGVLVTSVEQGGRAGLGGVQQNDIITHVNGRPTTTVDEFAAAVGRPGDLSIKLNRDGRRGVDAYIPRD